MERAELIEGHEGVGEGADESGGGGARRDETEVEPRAAGGEEGEVTGKRRTGETPVLPVGRS